MGFNATEDKLRHSGHNHRLIPIPSGQVSLSERIRQGSSMTVHKNRLARGELANYLLLARDTGADVFGARENSTTESIVPIS